MIKGKSFLILISILYVFLTPALSLSNFTHKAKLKIGLLGKATEKKDIRKIPQINDKIITTLRKYGVEPIKPLAFEKDIPLNMYLPTAEKLGVDVLIFYEFMPRGTLYTLNGRLILVDSNYSWGNFSEIGPKNFVFSNFLRNTVQALGQLVPVTFHIMSEPTNKAVFFDESPRKMTPLHVTEHKVLGQNVGIEVIFNLAKSICRRKEVKIIKDHQLVGKYFRRSDSEKPPCIHGVTR